MEKSRKDWALLCSVLIYTIGFLSSYGTSLGERLVCLLSAVFGLLGVLFMVYLLVNGKITNQLVILSLGILFSSPMYMMHFLVIPTNSKFIVVDGKIVNGFSWKTPFVNKVVEVNKNAHAKYDCFAVKEDPSEGDSSIKGSYSVNYGIEILNKEKFLEFVASEENPDKKISEAADKFLESLIIDAGLFKDNPRKNMEEFHDHRIPEWGISLVPKS